MTNNSFIVSKYSGWIINLTAVNSSVWLFLPSLDTFILIRDALRLALEMSNKETVNVSI
jgi:hypothetical protein